MASKARTIRELKAREKATFRNYTAEAVRNGESAKEALQRARKLAVTLGIMYEDEDMPGQLVAYILHLYGLEKAKADGIPAAKLFRSYVAWKLKEGKLFNDYGVWGDIIEVAVRFASKPENLFTYSDLAVRVGSKTDIRLRGVRFEIGHNGKTFADSDYGNPLAGPFELIAYGMIDKGEKKQAVKRCAAQGNDCRGLAMAILDMLYVFDRQTFEGFFGGRMGKGAFRWVPGLGAWQVRYNDSKQARFNKEIENSDIQTLAEWLAAH